MLFFPALAAVGASAGWAAGIVLAQGPAQKLGAFEFTRIQLVACAALLCLACTVLGYWPTVSWSFWPSFGLSILVGVLLGNLAMIECLRLGGPRRTELLLSLKAPIVAGLAFFMLGEVPSLADLTGALIVLSGVCLAIVYGDNDQSESDTLNGSAVSVVLLGLLAAAFQGYGFLVMKPAMLAGTEPVAASAIRLSGAAFAISFIALWPAKAFRRNAELSPGLLGWTVLPGFIGYGISSSLLLFAYANFDAGIAAVLGSLSPVLVLPILWLKDGHRPKAQAAVGALLAILGTSIIVLA